MPIKILIVDDSIFIRQVLTKHFEGDHRFNVVGTAINGKDALVKLEQLKPDVITMDVEMPIMNGIETLAAIMSQNPKPVIMLSSITTKGAQATIQALELGAIDFITKPEGALGHNIPEIINELKEKIIIAANSTPKKARLKVNIKTPVGPKYTSNKSCKIEFLIIGASTGGPSALAEVVSALPNNLNFPTLIVQHMPQGFTKLLAERLDHNSKLKVAEAIDGENLLPGRAYVVPAGYQVSLKRDGSTTKLNLTQKTVIKTPFKPSVDVTMLEVAKEFGCATMAVVLTGMGNDGLRGAKAIKSAGGKVLAEAQETCVVYGMPKAIVENNLADEVLPIHKIHEGILRNL